MLLISDTMFCCTYVSLQLCYYLLELHSQEANTFDIVVPITSLGVQLLCSIVDNVEALVDEWFPGLRDLSVVGGAELIKPMSLCPLCPSKMLLCYYIVTWSVALPCSYNDCGCPVLHIYA